MKLKNELFTLTDAQLQEGSGRAVARLNASSFIYGAHFPGQPITPGVCILQMGVELLGELLGSRLEVASVKNIKFLSVISPRDTETVVYDYKKIDRSADGREVKTQMVVTDLASGEVKAKISIVCEQHGTE